MFWKCSFDKSSTFLNLLFWAILEGRPYEIIIYDMAIVKKKRWK